MIMSMEDSVNLPIAGGSKVRALRIRLDHSWADQDDHDDEDPPATECRVAYGRRRLVPQEQYHEDIYGQRKCPERRKIVGGV